MSKGNIFENDLLQLIFNAVAIANIADNAATAPLTNLYVSLHTAWPGEAGNQQTSEAAYISYARVAVARTSGGWTVANNQAENAAAITFPASSGGSEDEMFFGIGTAATGIGKLLYIGKLGSLVGPAIFDDPAGDVITSQNHGLANNDRVAFFAAPGAALPTGITEGTVYHVISAATDTFQVSATQGGAAVDYSTDGDAAAWEIVLLAVSNGITPEFAAGALVINEN